MANVLHHVDGFFDFANRIPVLLVELVGFGKGKFSRRQLVDLTRPVSSDIARRGVKEGDVSEVLAQCNERLHAKGVHVERVVQRGIEIHHASRVDQRVHLATEPIAHLLGNARIGSVTSPEWESSGSNELLKRGPGYFSRRGSRAPLGTTSRQKRSAESSPSEGFARTTK